MIKKGKGKKSEKKAAEFAAVVPFAPKTVLASTLSQEQRDQRLEALDASLEKQFGKGLSSNLGDARTIDDSPFLVSTGSLAVDLAIGPLRKMPDGLWRHGLPPFRIVECAGPEATGKTTLLVQSCRRLQAQEKKLGLLASIIDVEHTLDPNYARNLGLDTTRLRYCQPDTGEQAIDIAEAQIRSEMFGIVGLDSIAALMTKKEIEGSSSDAHVAEVGRLMSAGLKRISDALRKSPCIFFMVNQMRSTIGFGDTTTGGKAIRYYCSIRMKVTKGDYMRAGEGMPPFGQRMAVQMIKNKLSPPFRTGDSPLVYGLGTDPVLELLELGIAYGIVEQKGAWLSHPCGLKAQGFANANLMMREHQRDWCRSIKDQLLTTIMLQRGQNPDGSFVPGYVAPKPPLVDEELDEVPPDEPEVASG